MRLLGNISIVISICFLVLFFRYDVIKRKSLEKKQEEEEKAKKLKLEEEERELKAKKEEERIENNKIELDKIINSKSINYNFLNKIIFSNDDKKFYFVEEDYTVKEYNYRDIIDVEIIKKEKKDTLLKKQNNVTGAVAGEILLGTAAGVVFGDKGQRMITNTTVTDLFLRITNNNFESPILELDFIKNIVIEAWLKESDPFKEIEKLKAIFKIVMKKGNY